jgi:hypothetical protein
MQLSILFLLLILYKYNNLQLLRRPKKDSVLSKHKKWLADLQKTKERLEIEYIDEIKKKEESQAKVINNSIQLS